MTLPRERPDAPFPPIAWALVCGVVFFYGLHLGAIAGWDNARGSAKAEIEAHVTVAQSDVAEAWAVAERLRQSVECVAVGKTKSGRWACFDLGVRP